MKSMTLVKWFSLVVAIIVSFILEFGILAPYLFSADDTILVMLGFASIVLYAYGILLTLNAVVKTVRKKYL